MKGKGYNYEFIVKMLGLGTYVYPNREGSQEMFRLIKH